MNITCTRSTGLHKQKAGADPLHLKETRKAIFRDNDGVIIDIERLYYTAA